MRNRFEHFDKKLEELPNTRYASRTVGPHDVLPSGHGYVRFGHFDPVGGLVTFGGECINIRAVIAECERMRPLALLEFKKKL